MNLPIAPPIKNFALLIAVSSALVTVTGCGNKGPLVRPTEMPAAAPAVPAASTVPPVDAEPVVDPQLPPVADPESGTPASRH